MFLDNFDVLMSKIIFKKLKKYQLQHVKNQLILYIEKNPAQRTGKSARYKLFQHESCRLQTTRMPKERRLHYERSGPDLAIHTNHKCKLRSPSRMICTNG